MVVGTSKVAPPTMLEFRFGEVIGQTIVTNYREDCESFLDQGNFPSLAVNLTDSVGYDDVQLELDDDFESLDGIIKDHDDDMSLIDAVSDIVGNNCDPNVNSDELLHIAELNGVPNESVCVAGLESFLKSFLSGNASCPVTFDPSGLLCLNSPMATMNHAKCRGFVKALRQYKDELNLVRVLETLTKMMKWDQPWESLVSCFRGGTIVSECYDEGKHVLNDDDLGTLGKFLVSNNGDVLLKILNATSVNSVDVFSPLPKELNATEKSRVDHSAETSKLSRPWVEVIAEFKGGTMLLKTGKWIQMYACFSGGNPKFEGHRKHTTSLEKSNFVWKVAWSTLLIVGAQNEEFGCGFLVILSEYKSYKRILQWIFTVDREDVIGELVGKGDLHDRYIDGEKTKIFDLYLEHVEAADFVAGGLQGCVIIILQHGIVKEFNGTNYVQTAYHCAKIFLNTDIEPIREYRSSKAVKRVDAGANESESGKTNTSWEGNAANGEDPIQPSSKKSFMCTKCNDTNAAITPRFKLQIRAVQGGTDIVLLLWDHEVRSLLNKSAIDVREKHVKRSDVTKEAYPVELDDLLGKKCLIKLDVSQRKESRDYGFIYPVAKVSNDPEIFEDFQKLHKLGQVEEVKFGTPSSKKFSDDTVYSMTDVTDDDDGLNTDTDSDSNEFDATPIKSLPNSRGKRLANDPESVQSNNTKKRVRVKVEKEA
ncbi:OLC1v1036403C1 [Oldenlandia corymbosa var. corymbosa]|uniref:OLC1v1036403C1 n=1 Tax=Oldenlandia corymbosa var. corymbosa TaxID=529605 RepID=A0AAV1CV76_OLDCO|nr:OLC1v1036403C1 [Oldenlandia corymbosa var. corymbosa]